MRLIFLLRYDIITCERKALTFFDKSEVAELINLPFEEKTVILYKNKKQALSINSNIR